MEAVSLALTLRENTRSPECIEKVKEAAQTMGLTPSSEGGATVCCRISPRAFRKLFDERLQQVPQRPPSASDHGAPPGFAAETLPVPESLKEWVEAICVLPPAIRLRGSL